jgi:hypothetical protein
MNARDTHGIWEPNTEEALDIARAWLEGGHYPIANYLSHFAALRDPIVAKHFGQLYQENGIRNIRRLQLSECEDPWFLVKHLSDCPSESTTSRDVILVAMSSSDHNDAYRERAWEFEDIRKSGETQGWEFDYVEVRDCSELAFHILRHQSQGSRVSVLHHLGHGSKDGAEFGKLDRDKRSELSRSEIFSDRDHRELCSIAQGTVDTWVLHHCSTAADDAKSNRRDSNLAEALHRATNQQVTVVGLRGNDAFDGFTHRRTSDNRVIFNGKPVWFGARRLQAKVD